MPITYSLRAATISDVPALLSLIRELALFEKSPESVTNNLERMEREGFGTARAFHAIVVESSDGGVVAMAVYYWAYSTWRGRYLYLEDLYVQQPLRGLGLGRLLLDEVIATARREGAALVKWQVLDWNEPAIAFYRQYGVDFDSEWIDCKLIFK